MDKLLIVIGTIFSIPLLFIIAALLNTLAGAFVGWVVGWFFTETILGIFAALGLKGFAMWQIGAFLGFFGSFFKTHVTQKS